MTTAGAPLIAKELGKGTVAVLHKKVAYKSLFLMDTQMPIYLYIAPLASCDSNDTNSSNPHFEHKSSIWFSEDIVTHILLANRTLHTFLLKAFQIVFYEEAAAARQRGGELFSHPFVLYVIVSKIFKYIALVKSGRTSFNIIVFLNINLFLPISTWQKYIFIF